MRRHPSNPRLVEWLNGKAPDLDDHVGACERCADNLADLDTDPSPIRDALETLLHPPADLAPAIRLRFERRARDRDALGLLGELLALPLHVARSLSEDQTPAPDPDRSHG